jgi:hypothetical protein
VKGGIQSYWIDGIKSLANDNIMAENHSGTKADLATFFADFLYLAESQSTEYTIQTENTTVVTLIHLCETNNMSDRR